MVGPRNVVEHIYIKLCSSRWFSLTAASPSSYTVDDCDRFLCLSDIYHLWTWESIPSACSRKCSNKAKLEERVYRSTKSQNYKNLWKPFTTLNFKLYGLPLKSHLDDSVCQFYYEHEKIMQIPLYFNVNLDHYYQCFLSMDRQVLIHLHLWASYPLFL